MIEKKISIQYEYKRDEGHRSNTFSFVPFSRLVFGLLLIFI
jgi:hypothetical protein